MNTSTTGTVRAFKPNTPNDKILDQSIAEAERDLAKLKAKQASEAERLRKEQVAEIERKRERQIDELEKANVRLKELSAALPHLKAKEDIYEATEEIEHLKKGIAQHNAILKLNEPEPEKQTFFELAFGHAGALVLSCVLFLLLAAFCNKQVGNLNEEINAWNKAAQDSGNMTQMLPPSISKLNMQKMWFSWLNVFCTLLGGIGVMGVLAPDKLLFILPFTEKKPIKRWRAFNEQTESQKQWQSFAYLACVLFFLAICQLAAK
jgi:hypothetical protein